MLCRYWSSNKEGYCEAYTCDKVRGDLEHLLVLCPALQECRVKMFNLWLRKTTQIPALHTLLRRIISAEPTVLVRFILDPVDHHEVLVLVQQYGRPLLQLVCYLTRTLAYNLHRKKLMLTGRWPGTGGKPPRTPGAKYDSEINTNCLSFVGSYIPVAQIIPPQTQSALVWVLVCGDAKC